jgi:hypothetical protein
MTVYNICVLNFSNYFMLEYKNKIKQKDSEPLK